jgi:malate synthase
LGEEYSKLLNADSNDVHDASKTTTLPIAREIAKVYVLNKTKLPWFIDLLNINLNNSDLKIAEKRIKMYLETFQSQGKRITENLDFPA